MLQPGSGRPARQGGWERLGSVGRLQDAARRGHAGQRKGAAGLCSVGGQTAKEIKLAAPGSSREEAETAVEPRDDASIGEASGSLIAKTAV